MCLHYAPCKLGVGEASTMSNFELTRRALLLGAVGVAASGCAPARLSWPGSLLGGSGDRQVNPAFRRRAVAYDGPELPGTIVVSTPERFLYHVEEGGRATRYGVAVGEEGLGFKGQATIGRKEMWPSWTPTANMIRRKPHLARYAGGVPGGENNPLGARALYLYQGGRDTYFRLHGTNEPWLIGQSVSNGCIRLTNEDVLHLYDRVPLGTYVTVT